MGLLVLKIVYLCLVVKLVSFFVLKIVLKLVEEVLWIFVNYVILVIVML